MVREQAKAKILKALRKREQRTLAILADEIGCKKGELTHAIRELVDEGSAIAHKGRTTAYTKA